MTREEISNYLYKELSDIYCHNCKYGYGQPEGDEYKEKEKYDPCEDCYRKMMGWEASKTFCDALADKILNKILKTEKT